MLYRDNKGSLEESMKTVIEINNINDIISHLNKIHKPLNKTIEEIKFQYLGYDSRIDWNTYYVLQRFENETEFNVAGMSNDYIIRNGD